MVADALGLMQRRDPTTGTVRLLGKDVLVRGCGMMPGGDSHHATRPSTLVEGCI
jgi:hypothetical protein